MSTKLSPWELSDESPLWCQPVRLREVPPQILSPSPAWEFPDGSFWVTAWGVRMAECVWNCAVQYGSPQPCVSVQVVEHLLCDRKFHWTALAQKDGDSEQK